MATRNRTARRARSRKASTPSRRQAALGRELQSLEQRQEDIYAVIAAAVAVLKAQAADSDCDVARCLRRGALEPLRDQVENLQAMVKRPAKAAL